jgi:hypothetical protein
MDAPVMMHTKLQWNANMHNEMQSNAMKCKVCNVMKLEVMQ